MIILLPLYHTRDPSSEGWMYLNIFMIKECDINSSKNKSFSMIWSIYICRALASKNTDRTLDVVFSRFRGFSFTITRRQKELHACRVELQDREREHTRNSFGLLPQGYILNEKLLNLEKTTSSVLSVLLLISERRVDRKLVEMVKQIISL